MTSRTAASRPPAAPTAALTFFPRSAAWPSSSRSDATASVSWSRSPASLRRISLSPAIAQCLRRELRLLERLLRDGRRSPAQEPEADYGEDPGHDDQPAEHDEQGLPHRQRARDAGRSGGEGERQGEEPEHRRGEHEPDSGRERGELVLHLGGCEFQLEPHERAGVVGDAARGARQAEAPVHALVRSAMDGRYPIHGRSFSSWAASRTSVASANGRPTSCTPTGRPSLQWSGSDIAGCPVTLITGVNGVNSNWRSKAARGSPSVSSNVQPIGTGGSASVGVTSTSTSSQKATILRVSACSR